MKSFRTILQHIIRIYFSTVSVIFVSMLIIFLSVSFCINPVIAADTDNNNKPVLKVIFSDDLKPWIFNVNGKLEGVYPEIIIELSNELNMTAEFMQYPLKRCEVMMEQGDADLMIGLKDTDERKKYIEFLKTPYRLSSTKVFYVRKGEKKKLEKFNDLYKLRIGTKLGTRYYPGFDDDKKIKKEDVNNEEQNFHKLLTNRIDALIIPEDRGEYLVSILNLNGKVEKASFNYPDGSPRFIGISKKSLYIKDLKKFNSAMKKMDDNGVLENLYMKHFLISII